jgi:hypothetical protein
MNRIRLSSSLLIAAALLAALAVQARAAGHSGSSGSSMHGGSFSSGSNFGSSGSSHVGSFSHAPTFTHSVTPHVSSAIVNQGHAINSATIHHGNIGTPAIVGHATLNALDANRHFRDFDRDRFHNQFLFGIWPYWYPWYADYGYYYPYSYYCYAYPQYYDYASQPAGAIASYGAPLPVADESGAAGASEGPKYLADARKVFAAGDFREALRLASHASIEMPRDAQTHGLMSLCLFALKDYRGAAMEAHAAADLGPLPSRSALLGYYGKTSTYSDQYEALMNFARDNPKSPEGQFLMGYHDLILGRTDLAKQHLKQSLTLMPGDTVAERLLK